MDITFRTPEGRFNYRVCAVILHDDKLLAMHDEGFPYYYLPGGRVTMHETAEQAVLREIKEELGIDAEIMRPLWLNQSFFTEDVKKERFHEICLYYYIDISKTDLLSYGETFTMTEGTRIHEFTWLDIHRLKSEYLYPTFIKETIHNLPQHLTILTEIE